MNPIKKALHKELSNTKLPKTHVWAKLQEKPKKRAMPIVVSISFILCLSIFGFLLWKSTAPTTSDSATPPNEETLGGPASLIEETDEGTIIPIIELEEINAFPLHDYGVHILYTQEMYSFMAKILKFEVKPINFLEHKILIIQYRSDGCGLVVDQLIQTNNQLRVQLELPEALRGKKELSCTAISAPHTAIVTIPRVPINLAVIIDGEEHDTITTLQPYFSDNDLQISEQMTKLMLKGTSIDPIYRLEDQTSISAITAILSQADREPGIANIASKPMFYLTLSNEQGDSESYQLWFNDEMTHTTIMNSKDTSTIYSIGIDYTSLLFDYLQRIMN